jgi:hypothetical protein
MTVCLEGIASVADLSSVLLGGMFDVSEDQQLSQLKAMQHS